MTGGSGDRAVGIESLTIGQLEDRLQLAMAVSQQLATRGVVNRHDIRVAVESIGLVLPTDMPVNSFTEVPSLTNYQSAFALVKKQVEDLTVSTVERKRRLIIEALEIANQQLRAERPPFEEKWKILKLTQCYLQGFESDQFEVELVDDILIQQKNTLDDALVGWRHWNELGQTYLDQQEPYLLAYALEGPVREALQNFLSLPVSAAKALTKDVEVFCSAVRTGAVVESAEVWDPITVVRRTVSFMEQYPGALPYRLQECEFALQRHRSALKQIDDLETLQELLILAGTLRDYLIATWRLESVRECAVDTALVVCNTAGVLRDATVA